MNIFIIHEYKKLILVLIKNKKYDLLNILELIEYNYDANNHNKNRRFATIGSDHQNQPATFAKQSSITNPYEITNDSLTQWKFFNRAKILSLTILCNEKNNNELKLLSYQFINKLMEIYNIFIMIILLNHIFAI